MVITFIMLRASSTQPVSRWSDTPLNSSCNTLCDTTGSWEEEEEKEEEEEEEEEWWFTVSVMTWNAFLIHECLLATEGARLIT